MSAAAVPTLHRLRVAAVVLASSVYVLLAFRAILRIVEWSDLNASARSALAGLVVISALGFALGLGQFVIYRARRGAAVPLIGLATFGSALCLLVIVV